MNAFKPLTVACLLSVIGCADAETRGPRAHDQDIEAINALLSEHVAAVNNSDVAANLDGIAEDVVYLPPEGPAVLGKQAIASFIGPFYETLDAEIEMVPEETVVTGDWAFQWGYLRGGFWPLEGGDTTVLDSKWLYLYQRQPDGSWRIARDIYNNNAPAEGGGDA